MSPTRPAGDVRALALDKLGAVLGPQRAEGLVAGFLETPGCELRTPQDLYRFSEELKGLGGFEAAVGAMLGVAAIIRGATPEGRGRGPSAVEERTSPPS